MTRKDLREIKYYKVTATFRGGHTKVKTIEVNPLNVDIKDRESMGEYFMGVIGMNSGEVKWTKTSPPKTFFKEKIKDLNSRIRSLKIKKQYYKEMLSKASL